jgi:hypothetical protein
MLTTGLVVCGLAILSPVLATATTRPSLVRNAEQPDAARPTTEGDWLGDGLMEYFTIPLGPYWMTPWPPDFCGSFVPARELEECGP